METQSFGRNWKVNEAVELQACLRKTCQDYAKCAVLSPNARNYRNIEDATTIQSNVLGAMRTLNIADLPPSRETGRCEVVSECIGGALTTKRYQVKKVSDQKIDIATLTRSCIGTSSAKPTVALYHRIAFLPLISGKAANSEGVKQDSRDDGFWVWVDKALETYHQAFDKAQILVIFEAAYEADTAIHGPPDHRIPITLIQDLESWLDTLNTAMEK
ncbi:hypothetical protein B0H13DRAFT_2300100 [Mycena leptocephala]|nr:hypothetical protein B0H13DRAFT_2300100 [Mycena leptocephala]